MYGRMHWHARHGRRREQLCVKLGFALKKALQRSTTHMSTATCRGLGPEERKRALSMGKKKHGPVSSFLLQEKGGGARNYLMMVRTIALSIPSCADDPDQRGFINRKLV